MADECLPTSSTASSEEVNIEESELSSKTKKLKSNDENDTLEERLTEILCCAVCLDLPKSAAFQCRNGHLMCTQCFNHLLADAHLRVTPAVCPSCRVPISRDTCIRNLIVEKAISELPIVCKDCQMKFPRILWDVHETRVCLERHTTCCYSRIGCPWNGPFKKKAEHEKRCAQPQKTGAEIKQAIAEMCPPSKTVSASKFTKNNLFPYLSFEKIQYKDLKLVGPYHTDGYFIRFETFRFEAFDMQWEVRAYVNNNEPDPTLSSERSLSYQLLLKESVERTIHIHYTIVNSPSGEMKLHPHVEEFHFSNKNLESHFALLPLKDSTECYRILSGTITFRLIMFWKDSEVIC